MLLYVTIRPSHSIKWFSLVWLLGFYLVKTHDFFFLPTPSHKKKGWMTKVLQFLISRGVCFKIASPQSDSLTQHVQLCLILCWNYFWRSNAPSIPLVSQDFRLCAVVGSPCSFPLWTKSNFEWFSHINVMLTDENILDNSY